MTTTRSGEWLQDLLKSVADRGYELLSRRRGKDAAGPSGHDTVGSLIELCRDLLSEQGEARGTALAREAMDAYRALNPQQATLFFTRLIDEFGPDPEAVELLFGAWKENPTPSARQKLLRAIEGRRQNLFRRLNMGPGGTASLVQMRAQLIADIATNSHLQSVDDDLRHLLTSWFNRGFLEFRPISWETPAFILEKLIAYEAVHAVRGWDDLRRRLAPDRRCYAFFHPALPNEPLIFVEVALVSGLANAISPIIDAPLIDLHASIADTAIFYSISNCQPGLRGINFGNFLIKQVVDELKRSHGQLKTFATLSPVPDFCKWLAQLDAAGFTLALGTQAEFATFSIADLPPLLSQVEAGISIPDSFAPLLRRLCAYYICDLTGGPIDPVARFHLGNGARLEEININADLSKRGLHQSCGIMVNYLYDPSLIVAHHETFMAHGNVPRSARIEAVLGPRDLNARRRAMAKS